MTATIAIPPTGQIKRMISKIEAAKEKRELKANLREYAHEFVEKIKAMKMVPVSVEVDICNMKRATLMLISRYLGIHRGTTTRIDDLIEMILEKIGR